MFSIDDFYEEYESESTEVVINRKKFSILLPRHLDPFINPADLFNDFPLWAKIWKASWVLAGYLAELPADVHKRILEVGGGVGMVSIVAAAFGHRITMTEFNPHALNFARANACRNNCPELPIFKLDWHRSALTERFDMIVASEITYKEEDFAPLARLFRSNLKPGGQILLASEIRKSGKDLFKFFQPDFDIRVIKKKLRSEATSIPVILIKMRPKKIEFEDLADEARRRIHDFVVEEMIKRYEKSD